MRILTYELGVMVTDIITKTKGMLTHLEVEMDESVRYIYQPHGLNPKTGGPVDRIVINEARVGDGKVITMDVPMEILGTEAEDIATGFKGKIVSLVYHINGCLHVTIKPSGVLAETGSTIEPNDFDIRRVKGEKITPFGVKKMKKDIEKKPSPISTKNVGRH